MRFTDRTISRPAPVLVAVLAALLLALAACTTESGASSEASASTEASTAESMEASTEASSEESAEASGEASSVMLMGFEFVPEEITVSAGDTVTFMNHDTAPHTVTEGTNGNAADGAAFDEEVAAGESVEITFDEAGDFDVTCLFHGNMNMVVHVE